MGPPRLLTPDTQTNLVLEAAALVGSPGCPGWARPAQQDVPGQPSQTQGPGGSRTGAQELAAGTRAPSTSVTAA